MTKTGDESALAEVETEMEDVSVVEDPKLVPVSEAIRYRKRAQAAEQEVGELQRQLDAVGSSLRETSEQMAAVERARSIDSQLVKAGVSDLESARLLVGAAIGEQGATEDGVGSVGDGSDADGGCAEVNVAKAIAEVRKRKPHLFRIVSSEVSPAAGSLGSGAMGGAVRIRNRQAAKPVATAAAQALASGRRQDVLRYMRLRRLGE